MNIFGIKFNCSIAQLVAATSVASVITCVMAPGRATAVSLVNNGITYDITTVTGTYGSFSAPVRTQISSSFWSSDFNLALSSANSLGLLTGFPTPLFVYSEPSIGFPLGLGFVFKPSFNSVGSGPIDNPTVGSFAISTPQAAAATSVPEPTGIVGTLFAAGVIIATRRKLSIVYKANARSGESS